MRNSVADGSLKLTPEETKLGWTMETLLAYQAERDKAIGYPVAGNIITPLARSKLPMKVMTSKNYNPHTGKPHA